MNKNPQIGDNPDWKPFLAAVIKATPFIDGRGVLKEFILGYPQKLQSVVGLALSVAKWHLDLHPTTDPACYDLRNGGRRNCGSCVYQDSIAGLYMGIIYLTPVV